jgi:zinc transport system ATP-binding protein
MQKIIELNDVTAGYDQEVALKDANLVVNEIDFVGVIGPNGGGKTTLVKLMVGLLKPMKGRVILHQQRNNGFQGVIGYLPQVNRFDTRFPISVLDVVLSGLLSEKSALSRFSRKDKEKAHSLLDRMGVESLYRKPIGELSGGQMQRVFLCRAIITSPKLLILDEPNTFVDNQFEADLYDTLKELNKQMAIMIVSHDVGTISYYVKTIACVNKYLHYHPSNIITEQQLAAYGCPIQIITHGDIPHTVLKKHNHQDAD